MCACAHNILIGAVRLTPREKVRLGKYKDKLRLIANRRLSISRKRREIQQNGGFLPALLAPLATSLSTAAASTIRLNGTREEDGVGRSTTVGNVADPDITNHRHKPTRPRFRNDKHTRQDRHRREREGAVVQSGVATLQRHGHNVRD